MNETKNNCGARADRGRKRGATSVEAFLQDQSLRRKYAITPLEYMLSVVNDKHAPGARRDDMAKNAAPYIHRRLAAVDPLSKELQPPVRYSLEHFQVTMNRL